MDHDAGAQQLVTTLVLRAAARFAEGKSRLEVIAELEADGAARDVAEAIASQGAAISQAGEAGPAETAVEVTPPVPVAEAAVVDVVEAPATESTGGGWSLRNLFRK